MKSLDALCTHVRETKTPEALHSAFESLCKVLSTGAFDRADRTKLVAAFLRTQASLKANVIQMSSRQGLLASMPPPRPVPIAAHEKDALLQRVAMADLEALERMRHQLLASTTSALFPPGEHKVILQSIDVRLMTLRASA